MAAAIILAVLAIRLRDFAAHGAWMIRSDAIGMGAGTHVRQQPLLGHRLAVGVEALALVPNVHSFTFPARPRPTIEPAWHRGGLALRLGWRGPKVKREAP
jgi:hypothetical protein